MNPLSELVEKLEKLANTPYRNMFTFPSPEEEAEYQKELDARVEEEADKAIENYRESR